MSYVSIACSMTEKINKDCKSALCGLLAHSTVVKKNYVWLPQMVVCIVGP